MPNKNYEKGRRAEYKTMKLLRETQWRCARTAGSHGQFDVIAWNKRKVRFIQVKFDCKPTNKESWLLERAVVPRGSTKEVWVWTTRDPEPKIEVIR